MKIQKLDLYFEENTTIGEIFKQYRLQNHLTISDVAAYLKLKEKDISDLEDDLIYDKKPTIFIRSLIKGYAKFLKINNKILEEKLESLSQKRESATKQHLLENDRYSPTAKQIGYALLVLIIAYSFFFHDFFVKNYLTSDLIIEKINNYDTQF